MMKIRWFIAAALVITAFAACGPKDAGREQARRDFDAYVGATSPDESRGIIARAVGVSRDEVRILHYGPLGDGTSYYYFAALGRNGVGLAGLLDEAQARVVREDYRARFEREGFNWAVKAMVNASPFSDRSARWGDALLVTLKRGPKTLTLTYIDGWVAGRRKWNVGGFTTNFAGTQIWDEKNDLAFAIGPSTETAPATPAGPPGTVTGTAAK